MAEHAYTPSPTALEQAKRLFSEIAFLASQSDRACFFFPDGGIEDPNHLEHAELELARLREAINLIGWMADLGAAKFAGQACVRGGAEEWLLSPAYLAIGERTKEASHG